MDHPSKVMAARPAMFANNLPIQRRALLAFGLASAILFTIWLASSQRHIAVSQLARDVWNGDPVSDVFNSTLGFQKVLTIGMPARTDKRDARTLAASVTGIDIEWIDGVDVGSMPAAAYPSKWNPKNHKPGVLGCWRAHMNALRYIVENNIASALIMEDDADWDVSLKEQLAHFARGVSALDATDGQDGDSATSPSTSPYSNGWDVLWLGHCGARPDPKKPQHIYELAHDPTAASLDRIKGNIVSWPNKDFLTSESRIVFGKPAQAMCLYGYAVTLQAARVLLAQLSMQPLDDPVDFGLEAMCGAGGSSIRDQLDKPLRCYLPFPTLVGTHRAAGPESKDSDIEFITAQGQPKGVYAGKEHRPIDADTKWHGAYTNGIMYSVLLNMQRLLAGKPALPQWKDDSTDADKQQEEEQGHVQLQVAGLEGRLRWVDLESDKDAKKKSRSKKRGDKA